MKPWWSVPIFAAGLLAGVAVGHRAGGGAASSSTAGSEAPSRRASHAARPVEQEAKWRSIARSAAGMDDKGRSALVMNLNAAERITALEALAAQAGPGGLEQDLQYMMRNILHQWAKEDFDGAWKWSEHCEPPGFQTFAKQALLEDLVRREPEQALELHARQVERDPNFTSEVSGKFLEKMAMKDADGFVDVLSKFSFKAGGMGPRVKFAEGFDFRKAADGVAAMSDPATERKPYEFPSNFVEEWCKRDLEGAHQWLMSNPKLPFGGWSDVFEAVEISRGVEEAGAWAAAEIGKSGDSRARIIGGLDGLSRSRMEGSLRAIANALPDVAARDRFFLDVVAENPYSMEGAAGSAIAGMSSPEARLEAFRKMKEKHAYINAAGMTAAQLQQWGITRQQVREIAEEDPPEK